MELSATITLGCCFSSCDTASGEYDFCEQVISIRGQFDIRGKVVFPVPESWGLHWSDEGTADGVYCPDHVVLAKVLEEP